MENYRKKVLNHKQLTLKKIIHPYKTMKRDQLNLHQITQVASSNTGSKEVKFYLQQRNVLQVIFQEEKKSVVFIVSQHGELQQDLFLNFYKHECRRQKQIINIFSLILGDSLNRNKSSIYSSRRLSRRFDNTFLFEMSSHDSVYEGINYDTSSYFVSRQQKFIEQWQEYFFQHSRFLNICLKCNDLAQTEFIQEVSIYRQLSLKNYKEDYERYLQILSKQLLEEEDTEISQQFLNSPSIVSSHQLFNIQLQKDESNEYEDNSSTPQLICDIMFNTHQNKKQTILLPQNTIIKEENNEDQSYIGDRLSKRGSIEFYSPQIKRNKSSLRTNVLLKRSKSSIKSNYTSPQLNGQRLSTFRGQNGGKSLEELTLNLVESKIQSKEEDTNFKQQQENNERINQEQNMSQRERNFSEGAQLSYRSAKSFSKTHPDASQNNIDEINTPKRSEKLNNSDYSKQIEEINRNLEEQQNRSFRILATLNKVSDDIPKQEENNEEDYNINNNYKQVTVQDLNEYLENYKNQKSIDSDDSDSDSDNDNKKQPRKIQSNARISRNQLTVLLEKSRISKTKSQQKLDEENIEGKYNNFDSANFLQDHDSKIQDKPESLMFLNTSQNQLQFITPLKPNLKENEQNLFTENDKFQTQLQFNSIIEENNNIQSQAQFALFEIQDFPEQ